MAPPCASADFIPMGACSRSGRHVCAPAACAAVAYSEPGPPARMDFGENHVTNAPEGTQGSGFIELEQHALQGQCVKAERRAAL